MQTASDPVTDTVHVRVCEARGAQAGTGICARVREGGTRGLVRKRCAVVCVVGEARHPYACVTVRRVGKGEFMCTRGSCAVR